MSFSKVKYLLLHAALDNMTVDLKFLVSGLD